MIMRSDKLVDWYRGGLGLILFLVVLHAPLTVGLGTLIPDFSLLLKVWKEVLLLILTAMAAIIVTRRQLWRTLFDDWLIRLALIYGLLHLLLLALNWSGFEIAAAGLAIDLRFILMMVLTYLAVYLTPGSLAWFKKVAVMGAVIVVGFAALQLILPADSLKYLGYNQATIKPYLTIDQNQNYVRHNSTLRGPNPMGAYAASVVLIGLALLTARAQAAKLNKLTLALVGGGLVALVSSFSRSAALALVLGGLLILLVRYGRKLNRAGVATILAGLVVLSLGFGLMRDNSFISHLILHEDPNESGLVNSNDEHLSSLENGSNRLLAQPLGAGIGSTGSASLYGEAPLIIENQYLYVAHESGWLGLALFLAIYGLALRRLYQQRLDPWALGLLASGIGLAAAAMFLPVWADDTVAIVWWGLAGALIVNSKRRFKN